MNVPLARLLTRFPVAEAVMSMPMPDDPVSDDPVSDDPVPDDSGPIISELEIQIDAVRRDADRHLEERIAALESAHAEAMTTALDAARASWCADQAETLGRQIDAAFLDLRSHLSERIADVLKPLLGEALSERTRAVLIETLDLALNGRDQTCLTLRGPGDLIEAIRAARPDATRITYVPHDSLDVIVTGDGLRIETHLEQALTALAAAGA